MINDGNNDGEMMTIVTLKEIKEREKKIVVDSAEVQKLILTI